MRFESITLAAGDLAAQREFYAGVLGLVMLDEIEGRFAVQAGATRLTFVAGGAEPSHHIAFNVPENLIEDAARWLSERRVPIFGHNGQQIVTQSPLWDAHSMYFRDPDGNVVEFIARHRLRDGVGEPFDPARHVRCVSELGVPVVGASELAERLQREARLPTYGNTQQTFIPLGGERGLLIVVERGRNWFPTTTPALSGPLEAKMRAGVERTTELMVDATRLRFVPEERGAS